MMFAKCAAWPPSCINVVSAVFPLPTSSGVASDVKLARLGFHLPSWPTCGATGQWQNPLGYFPTRSHKSRRITVSRYLMPIAANDRPQTSGAFSKGKYGSNSRVSSPESAYARFHGFKASAPFSDSSFFSAFSKIGRVAFSSPSSISKHVFLSNPSACVTFMS